MYFFEAGRQAVGQSVTDWATERVTGALSLRAAELHCWLVLVLLLLLLLPRLPPLTLH